MKLYYNRQKNNWVHATPNETFFIGANHTPVAYSIQSGDRNNLIFHVQQKNRQIGPVVGVLIHMNQHGKLVVNQEFINALALRLYQERMIPVLVPIENIKKDQIKGAIFHPKHKWVECLVPLPDIIFNRVSNRRAEKSKYFQEAVQFINEKNIPFFNPHFLDKYETYHLLKSDVSLRPYIPETIALDQKEALRKFLSEWTTVYLKPRTNFKGKGIFILKQLRNGKIAIKNFDEKWVYQDFEQFWRLKGKPLNRRNYLVQQAIFPATYNGRRYDFRVLAHYKDNQYHIIGVGVRLAGHHNITTHIPRGGKLMHYQAFQSDELDQKLASIINAIGQKLTSHYGIFGEFSVDIGLTKNHDLRIFEVNAKPMVFDETAIEDARLKHLSELLIKMTGFE